MHSGNVPLKSMKYTFFKRTINYDFITNLQSTQGKEVHFKFSKDDLISLENELFLQCIIQVTVYPR